MKKSITLFCSILILSMCLPAFAGKPEGNAHKNEKAHKEAAEDAAEDAAEKSDKEKANKSDKSDVEMKEADRGSETGQQKREENRRKWWKFWE